MRQVRVGSGGGVTSEGTVDPDVSLSARRMLAGGEESPVGQVLK